MAVAFLPPCWTRCLLKSEAFSQMVGICCKLFLLLLLWPCSLEDELEVNDEAAEVELLAELLASPLDEEEPEPVLEVKPVEGEDDDDAGVDDGGGAIVVVVVVPSVLECLGLFGCRGIILADR